MATINDIAARAGVSPSTVSRVLNHEPYVKEETRIAVLNAVRELDYKPNIPSVFLASKDAKEPRDIGFFLDSSLYPISYDPFLSRVITGMFVEGSKQGCRVSSFAREGHSNEEIVESIIRNNIRGIVALHSSEDLFALLREMKIPVVTVNELCTAMEIPAVLIDNFYGAKAAVDYLIELGCKRIAFVGGVYSWGVHGSISERLCAYKYSLEQAGIDVDPDLIVMGSFNSVPPAISAGYDCTKRLLSRQKVDGIFAATDALAIGVAHYANEYGLKIPDDFNLVGFDNIASSEHLIPPLTTVNVPKEEMGAMAVKKCIRMLKKADPLNSGVPLITRVATNLVVRSSCESRL